MSVSFRVNGRKGWGLAEWDYRHHGGRPRAYSFTDPAWTADLVKGQTSVKDCIAMHVLLAHTDMLLTIAW